MTEYICENCGDTVNGSFDHDTWNCVICGGTMTKADGTDVVPKEALRELVRKWRQHGQERAADDLESILGDSDD